MKYLIALALFACSTVFATPVWTPAKPILFIGGGTIGNPGDVLMRRIMLELNLPIVMINRPGADGVVPLNNFVGQEPDGYKAVVLGGGTFVIPDTTMPSVVKFKQSDFVLATLFALSSSAIVTGSATTSVESALRDLKQGRKTLGTDGFSGQMISTLLITQAGNKEAIAIMYKDVASLIGDSTTNRINYAALQLSLAYPYQTAGKLKVLAISDAKRQSVIKDVPTLNEFYPGAIWQSSWMIVLPAGTSPSVVAYYQGRVKEALTSTSVKSYMATNMLHLTPEETGEATANEWVKKHREKWVPVLKTLDLK